MIIKRQHSMQGVIEELAAVPECGWVARVDPIDACGLLRAPRRLAWWIAEHAPRMLLRPRIDVTVFGSAVECADSGAWWDCLGPMLGKSPEWLRLRLIDVSATKVPVFCTGAPVVSRCAVIADEEAGSICGAWGERQDIIFISGLEAMGASRLLESHIDEAIKATASGSTLLTWSNDFVEWALFEERARLLGLDAEGDDASSTGMSEEGLHPDGRMSWASGDSRTKERAEMTERLEKLRQIESVARSVCKGSHRGPAEDFRLWGVTGLLRSSVDVQDTYVSLPRNYVARTRTGKIYVNTDDIATGNPAPMVLQQDVFEAISAQPGHWIDRAWVAARVWAVALEAYDRTTLRGKLIDRGIAVDAASLRERAARLGYKDETTQEVAGFLVAAVTGGEPYVGSREERELFSLIDAGRYAEAISRVEGNRSLLAARNEMRQPLALVACRTGHIDFARRLFRMGMDADAVDGLGTPTLVSLASFADPEMLNLVMAAGANENAADELGITALLASTLSRRWESVKLLIERGADPKKEAGGLSPYKIANGDSNAGSNAMDLDKGMFERAFGFPVERERAASRQLAEDMPASIRALLLGEKESKERSELRSGDGER